MIAADDLAHNENNIQNEEEKYNEDEDVWNDVKHSELSGETLTKVCNNDPSITALSIQTPYNIDWDSEGKSFGANNKLKYLYITYLESTKYDDYENEIPIDAEDKQNIELFFREIGSNRSIETFGIAESDLETGLSNIFNGAISSFFEYNDKLRNIGFFECSIGDGNYNSLISALSRRRNKSSLRLLET